MRLNREIKKFYDDLDLEPEKIVKIAKSRMGISEDSIELAMVRIYSVRDKFPKISLGHRIYMEARRLEPFLEEWKKRPWWKRWYHSFLFPSKMALECDQWHISRK
jgi:hypothetical protein